MTGGGRMADESEKDAMELLDIRNRVAQFLAAQRPETHNSTAQQAILSAQDAIAEALSAYFYFPLELEAGDAEVAALPDTDGVVARYEVAGTQGTFAVLLPRNTLRLMVNASYGGSHMDPRVGSPIELTRFEIAFAEDVSRRILKAALRTIDKTMPGKITLREAEAFRSPDEVSEAPGRDDGLIAVSWKLHLKEQAAELLLCIPAAIAGGHAHAEQAVDEEAGGDDAMLQNWSQQMHISVSSASVELTAVIDCPDQTLEDIGALEVGSTLQVWDTNRSHATLVCDGEPLFRCGIGQKDGHFAISIDGKINQWNGFVDEIAGEDERAAPRSLPD